MKSSRRRVPTGSALSAINLALSSWPSTPDRLLAESTEYDDRGAVVSLIGRVSQEPRDGLGRRLVVATDSVYVEAIQLAKPLPSEARRPRRA